MRKSGRRNPRNYNGTRLTSHQITDILPHVLANIGNTYSENGHAILAAWPLIIGPQLAPMTQAVAFNEGKLVVNVKNSTLYSLLTPNEKWRILKKLQQKFPKVSIKEVLFRIA